VEASSEAWARQVRAGTAGNFDELNARLAGTTYDRHLRFLNFGYEPLEGEPRPGPSLPVAFPNKDAARLVFAVIGDTDLTGARVLDVGCGRGGAVGLLARYAGARSLVGLDLSAGNVAFATTTATPGTTAFAQGSAEQLPFAGGRFDAVFNLESSACYPSMASFYREVARVVRPGGAFLYADLFPEAVQQPCRDALAACGFDVLAERDITEQVVRSRTRRAERQRKALEVAGSDLDEWLGLEGSSLFTRLEQRTARYLAFRLRRTDAPAQDGPLFDEQAAALLRATAEEAVQLLDGLA
jgi:SAM-dependent methyltransferase